MIEVRSLTREFTVRKREPGQNTAARRTMRALDSLDLTVERGEVYGLVGPNGAGKTTLVKIISTLLLPTSGRVLVDGLDTVQDGPAVRASIGLSAECERSFYWRLTGRQNLLFFGALQGLTRQQARQKVDQLVGELDLGQYVDTRFMQYSAGMKRKLSFARAMLLDPPLVLLDEPTSNVDPLSAEQMRRYIAGLRESGKTVLLTSHNMSEVERLADRVGILLKGRMAAEGTMEQLRKIQGRSVIRLTTEDSPDGLFSQLRGLACVEKLDEHERTCRLVVENGPAALDEVLRIVVTQGVRLVDIRVEHPSLEDVFFMLTGGGRDV